MKVFQIEHTRLAYRVDFAVHAAAVVVLTAALLVLGPAMQWRGLLATVLAGLGAWTFLEYVLHRFVLHGVAPFSDWHRQHHLRPLALICSPTVLSAALFASLVFLPALALAGLWPALALTLGVMLGYVAYTLTHHALHHWHMDHAWFNERRRWHAMHHHPGLKPSRFGVTSSLWDRVFFSARSTPRGYASAQTRPQSRPTTRPSPRSSPSGTHKDTR